MKDRLHVTRLTSTVSDFDLRTFRDNFAIQGAASFLKAVWDDRLSRAALLWILFILLLAFVGPYVTPYEYDERVWSDDDQLLRGESPSLSHPLGTTDGGYDIFSRLIFGAQPTALIGFLGGATIISIGTTVGVTAGYVGGYVENVLMRVTDFWYIIPFIPFAIVIITLYGIGFWSSILLIGLVLWRGSARVLRSQVLQIKERPFVVAARATGASTPYIIYKHILPNIASMIVLFFAFGMGTSILAYAGLAFLGVSDPFIPDWGVMLRNAHRSGAMRSNWLWAIAPGMFISFTVLSVYIIGRRYEALVSGDVGSTTMEEVTNQ